MTLKIGQTIDERYLVKAHLGQGGMGSVWKVQDTRVGDEVVIKLPLNHGDPEILRRFGEEARTMRRFSSDCMNILDIQDVGDHDGIPYYVMRYLPGGSLREWTIPKSVDGRSVCDTNSFDWLTSIANSLDFLHSEGCLHRDVKPENILFNRRGDAFLVDFGIVKTPVEATTMTRADESPGTLAYMPPEVLLGDTSINGKADQYALAITLYEVLAGKRPYAGPTSVAVYKAINEGHQPLAKANPAISEAASQVIDRALSPNVEQRFASCGEFADAFVSNLNSVEAAPFSPEESVIDAASVELLAPATMTATPSGPSLAPPQAKSYPPTRNRWKWPLVFLIGIFVVGSLALVAIPLISGVRGAAQQLSCASNLKQIQLGILNYESTHTKFPPAYIADDNGRPMHSWRVLILPFLGEQALFEQYRMEEPWDSSHNLTLTKANVPPVYQCPAFPGKGKSSITSYLAVAGSGALFTESEEPFRNNASSHGRSIGEINDGMSNTLSVVEVKNSNVHWSEPRDWDVASSSFVVNAEQRNEIGSHHFDAANVVFGNGLTIPLNEKTDPENLKGMTTIAGGETVEIP